MITAEEARKIAQDSEEDNKTAFKFIGNLNNAIEKEAARGFFEICICFEFNDLVSSIVIEYLRFRGYKVEYYSDKKRIGISWR
jgi:hypothetical protein